LTVKEQTSNCIAEANEFAPGVDVDTDVLIARIDPTVMLDALAMFCACVRASEIRPDAGHVCACCACAETCIP
jgi:hypothetical protein